MSQTYYTILTKQGAALLANATALGVPLKLTQMGVGDGNGSIPKPLATQTKLVHEVRRAAINTLFIDKQNSNQIIAEQVIPENEGGWFIHEIGLYDDEGNLIAVGNCPATYKPKLVEGSGRTQVIRMVIIVDNVNSVELKIDPSVVLATREYVDNLIATKMEAHEKSTNHPTATTKSKGFVQLSSATNSTAENQAATPLAVKNTYDLAANSVKKSGDVINGQLTFEYKAYGIKFNYENPDNVTVIRPNGDNFSFLFYDAEKKNWFTKLRYTKDGNAWRFENINNVTINGKPVLKDGDAVRLFGDLSDKSLNTLDGSTEGIYFQGKNILATSEKGYPINQAGTLNVMKNDADGAGCCQTYTTYRSARQFIRNYRGGTKTWEPWVEVITTANVELSNLIDKFQSSGFESRVYSHDKRFYLIVRDDGVVGMYNSVRGTLPWGFNVDGVLAEGYVPAHRVLNLEQYIRNFTLPPGIPLPWPQVQPPAGWFECNGSIFDKNQYPKLAKAYPSGYLPDLRGEFIRGWDNGRGVDPGRSILYWQAQQVSAHRHVGGLGENFSRSEPWRRERMAPFGSTGDQGIWGGVLNSDLDNPLFYTNDGTNGGITIQSTTTRWDDLNPVGLVGHETRPRNVAFMYIVKAE
ncbi:phage tail protein [Gilliamella sp. B2838]|uniref:phage tail-collar fiber domain-containing protein n=1 Tax=Gilliamella sp. B2838 TaxID=2818020 RepID=UPI00226A0826|nr:phage tail protein [Gilliamella sp. B2838]MCX8727201.1 phage tail protein [Gilliamella sp. B2838]